MKYYWLNISIQFNIFEILYIKFVIKFVYASISKMRERPIQKKKKTSRKFQISNFKYEVSNLGPTS